MTLPVNMTLKRSGLDPKNRPLEITADQIHYDGARLSCDRIAAVKYGSLRMEGASTGAWISDIHEFQLRDDADNKLRVTFSASFGKKNKQQATETYLTIEEGIQAAITDRIAGGINQAVASGAEVTVGPVRLDGQGVHFQQGLLRKKAVAIPWTDLVWRVENGELVLLARSDGKRRIGLKLLSVWNAVALARALQLAGR